MVCIYSVIASDERRLAALESRLSQKLPQSTITTKTREVAYAGGVFSRLEGQFRAQQAAKTMASQGQQSRNT